MKCKKCGHEAEPIVIVEPFPCGSIQVNDEDTDYLAHKDGFDVDGDIQIGLEVCRNCHAIAGFWIEDANNAEFYSDFGK